MDPVTNDLHSSEVCGKKKWDEEKSTELGRLDQ